MRLSKVVVRWLDWRIVPEAAIRSAAKAILKVVRKLVVDVKELVMRNVNRGEVDPISACMMVMVWLV